MTTYHITYQDSQIWNTHFPHRTADITLLPGQTSKVVFQDFINGLVDNFLDDKNDWVDNTKEYLNFFQYLEKKALPVISALENRLIDYIDNNYFANKNGVTNYLDVLSLYMDFCEIKNEVLTSEKIEQFYPPNSCVDGYLPHYLVTSAIDLVTLSGEKIQYLQKIEDAAEYALSLHESKGEYLPYSLQQVLQEFFCEERYSKFFKDLIPTELCTIEDYQQSTFTFNANTVANLYGIEENHIWHMKDTLLHYFEVCSNKKQWVNIHSYTTATVKENLTFNLSFINSEDQIHFKKFHKTVSPILPEEMSHKEFSQEAVEQTLESITFAHKLGNSLPQKSTHKFKKI